MVYVTEKIRYLNLYVYFLVSMDETSFYNSTKIRLSFINNILQQINKSTE